MCFEYDGYCQAYCETWRRAQKPHKCASCRRVIHVGDKYADITGIDWERTPFRVRACAWCMAQQEVIRQAELVDGCPNHSAVCAIEDIAEHVLNSGMDWVSDELAAAFAEDKYNQQRKVTT